jgi:flagellar biogenesis protein FliO
MSTFLEVLQKFTTTQNVFRRSHKRLRLSETISLGPRGFVALVELDGEEMLIGGAGHSISVLTKAAPKPAMRKAVSKTSKSIVARVITAAPVIPTFTAKSTKKRAPKKAANPVAGAETVAIQ